MEVLALSFIVALVLSACGFWMYVYFFSVGYGLSITGIAVLLLVLFRNHLSVYSVIFFALFIFYGLRLGGYLAIREMRSTAYKNLLKGESKQNVPLGVKLCIWLSVAILYVCQCAPLTFRFVNETKDDAFLIAGIIICALGIIMESVADMQKTLAKKKNPKKFVSSGLYKIVRCPNYFGEILLWTGAFVSGISSYLGILEWCISILGYLGILYVMFSGARRLELRQDRNYGSDEEYQKYIKKTPILIPLLPLYSVKKYKWLVA